MSIREWEELSDLLVTSQATMALTGAGISARSGIPTFRGVQGLWEKYDILEYAHIDAFLSNPSKVWRMLLELDETIVAARPNPAHLALAELEKMGLMGMVVTQNVDNLHQNAGSRQVVEFHGNALKFRCLDCRRVYERCQVDLVNIPLYCVCGGLVKPDVIFFGEAIPWEATSKAFDTARRTDLILVIGTSAGVVPASEIPVMAKNAGAMVVEINLEATLLTDAVTDLFIGGCAAEVLPSVVNLVRGKLH